MIGIGIDTGGTYTDAVLYDMNEKKLLCTGKSLTTKTNLEIGIENALNTLDAELVKKAEMMALSTTLATNACVENKGSRARLLMIGADRELAESLAHVYEAYGFWDMDQVVFLDGKPKDMFRYAKEPDWESFEASVQDAFSDCASVGIVQMYPQVNGAKFEKTAGKMIQRKLPAAVTMAHDLFDEPDVLKRGAGTLLNAHLTPLIAEFLKAVKRVMNKRGLHIPVAVVRSDGSLMSERMAKECPVETLLSGPAASVVGGSVITGKRDAVIVDMGGTTTDVALVHDNAPVMAGEGITIGKWKTMVKGLYVDTFGLGGDSAVRADKNKIFVDSVRVIPVSVLAKDYPGITERLLGLAELERVHTRPLYEFYVLLKDISGDHAYSAEEQSVCRALKDGPLMPLELADTLKTDIYSLRTGRLEAEGVLIKSGLTPTDMMVVKGDFDQYDSAAALAALECLAVNAKIDASCIPDMVYDMVVKKMYCNIVRILMMQEHPCKAKTCGTKEFEDFIEWSYQDAKRKRKKPLITMPPAVQIPLIGVGAPVHIFLPEVARLLGTQAVIPAHAEVANALGAIAGQVLTKVQVKVRAEYQNAQLIGYSVFDDTKMRMFEAYEEAEAFALSQVKNRIVKRAEKQGASQKPSINISVQKIKSPTQGVLFESIVQAVATDCFAG
jgi:N-methylhydantoinase A/oxoprolinase/acetone carboxylase beta subunit